MLKKTVAALIAVMLLAALTGCNMVEYDAEKDGARIVADVHGTQITKSEVMNDYELYKSYYGLTDANENQAEYAETKKNLISNMLDSRITSVLAAQKAAEYGVDALSEEQQKNIDDSVADMENYVTEKVAKEIQTMKDNGEEVDEEAKTTELTAKYRDEYSLSNGVYEKNLVEQAVQNNLKDYLSKDLSISDDEIKAYYDTQLAEQQPAIEEEASAYGSYTIHCYKPETKNVKNLLIALSDDVKAEIQTLTDDGKTDEANAKTTEENAKLKTTADDVYAQAKAGTDFDTLMEKYGSDTGMTVEPAKSEGYEIYTGMQTMDSVFVEAGMALANIGDISEPTFSEQYGYYILQLVSKSEAQVIPLADLSDSIKESLFNTKTTETFDTSMETWKAEDGVTTYTDILLGQ